MTNYKQLWMEQPESSLKAAWCLSDFLADRLSYVESEIEEQRQQLNFMVVCDPVRKYA